VAAGPFHDTDTQSYTVEDFRFTTKGNDLFAIELGWSDSGQTVIHALSPSGLSGRRIRTVAMLGSDTSLVYQQSTDGLHIKLPLKPGGEYICVPHWARWTGAAGSDLQMTCHRFAAMKAK
jgi:alpha-L-fucosidase